jgi:hypothetical protein
MVSRATLGYIGVKLRMHNTTAHRVLYGLLIITTISTFLGNHYLIDMPDGHLTDLLEGPISAYGSGRLVYHEYGPLYTALNMLAARMVTAFPAILHPFDIAMLRASFIAVALGMGCWCINRAEHRIPPCLTLLAISCALQPHTLFTLHHLQDITWHNMANNQMLGLLVCLLPLIWRTKHAIGPLGCILVGYSVLHFMPSFFFAVSALILMILAQTYRRPLFPICSVSLGVILLSLGTAAFLSAPIPTPSFHIPIGPTCITIILYSIGQLLLHHATLLPFALDKTPSPVIPDYLIQHRATIARRLYNHLAQPRQGVITITLLTLVASQTLSAACAVALVLMIEILSTPVAPHNRSAITLLVMGIVLYHTLVLTRITMYKFYQPSLERPDQLVTMQSTHTAPASVVIRKYEGYDYFQRLFQLADNPAASDFYQRLSYDYNRKQTRWRIPFYNQEYIQMINQATAYFQQWPLSPDTQVVMLGKVNPLPMLLHTPMPEHSYLSRPPAHAFDSQLPPLYQAADFIYLPLFAIPDASSTDDQTDINCHFYQWNHTQHRFHLVQVTPYGCIFATDQSMAQYQLSPVPAHAASQINTTCQQRHA